MKYMPKAINKIPQHLFAVIFSFKIKEDANVENNTMDDSTIPTT